MRCMAGPQAGIPTLVPSLLQLVSWLGPSALLAAAFTGLRRRNVDGSAEGQLPRSTLPSPSAIGPKSGAAALAAAALLLVLGAAALYAAGVRDSWGNRWLLQRAAACKPPGPAGRPGAWGDLGGFNHSMLTRSPEAQQLFNQGLLLAWDFNRAESQASFQACLAADPQAAMCHWGLAYSLGPYLNLVPGSEREGQTFPVLGPAAFEAAQRAARQAQLLAEQALENDPGSPVAQWELDICSATAARFAAGTHSGAARDAAERAYAEAMQMLGESKEDATALALAAEAYMNLVPWDFLDPATGAQRPAAAAANGLLLRALRLRPRHELALHLHVHLAEAGAPGASGVALAGDKEGGGAEGPSSEGERSADQLAGLQPRMAHLLHMPSHLYIRVGRYHDAVKVNVRAYAADVAAAQGCLQSYIPEHNLHMLMFAASMAGQYAVLQEWGGKLWALPDVMPRSAWPGRERTILLLAQVRFAEWDAVLSTPPPTKYERGPGDPGGHQYATVVWRFARCLALSSRTAAAGAAQNRAAAQRLRGEAGEELEQLSAAVEALPHDVRTRPGQGMGIYSNDNAGLGAVAIKVAQARLHALDGRWREAAAALGAAAEQEQGLGYLEPPRLLQQPAAQCLGWVLLHWGRYEAAAEAYRSDLARHPANGWSLLGLSQALMRSGHSREAAGVRERFEQAWQHADRPITSSCPAFAG